MANNTAIYDSDLDLDEDKNYASDSEESLLNSPADGYFSPRNHPQETFIPNPAVGQQDSSEAEAKAEEAAAERSREQLQTTRSSASSAPRAAPHSSAEQRHRWPAAGERTPLLDAGPAPPDYAAATAGRRRERASFGEHHPLVRNGLFGEQGS